MSSPGRSAFCVHGCGPSSPVECPHVRESTVDRVAALLAAHYKAASWAYQARSYVPASAPGPRLGHWSCSCGAGGDLGAGESATDQWRWHVAVVLVSSGLGRL